MNFYHEEHEKNILCVSKSEDQKICFSQSPQSPQSKTKTFYYYKPKTNSFSLRSLRALVTEGNGREIIFQTVSHCHF